MNTTKRLFQETLTARISRGAMKPRRRGGQALLLAVLLMVFAALLGSTFITVVALNLSQTSRGESKQDARNSAQAGLREANTQLQVSEQGERWRPEQVNTPPFCGDASTPAAIDCDAYYTPFEKAQGWARDVPPASSSDEKSGKWDNDDTKITQSDDWAKLEYFKKNYGKRVFVKFPDPRQISGSSAQRPTYLVEVKPVTKGEKKDELQIDVIGRSNNSETAFFRTTTNKGTSTSGAPTAFALYQGNYNTETGKPLETELVSSDTASLTDPSITVKDARGITPGMTLLLQQGTGTSSTFRDAVVREAQTTTGRISLRVLRTTGTPETPYDATYTVGSKVRVVSTLMDGLPSLDDDGDGAAGTAPVSSVELPVRSASDSSTTGTRKAVGAHFNNGLVVKENAVVGLSPRAPDADNPTRKDYLHVQGRVITSSGARLRDASASGATPVAMPSSAGDPGTGANKIASTGLSGVQLQVRDSVQTDAGDPTQRGNNVRSIAPPSLDSSSDRYLKLTKLADVENGSIYGYGPGVFIDNRDDTEKVGVTVPAASAASYRALSVSDLHRFWQRKSFVARRESITSPTPVAYKDDLAPNVPVGVHRGQDDQTHLRHDLSFATAATSGSLEQQRVRGWISPTEFLPRGVLVELNGNTIIITRDDLSDAGGSAPDDGKAWKDPQGQNKQAAPTMSLMSPRNYRMVLNLTDGQRSFGAPGREVKIGDATTFNGLIYAEGNVRVRGVVGNLDKDITIVSMGNIYVEGSIKRADANSDHVALLAKKNVVLNPTQFMPRLAGLKNNAQHAVANTATVYGVATTGAGGTTDIPVSQAQAFRIGDRVRVGTNANWTTVTAIGATTPNVPNPDVAVGGTANVATLSLYPALTPTPVLGEAINTLGEPTISSGARYYEFGGSAASTGSMFTRNVPLAAVEPHYLWLLHAGGRTVFDLKKTDNSGPNTREVLLKADNSRPASVPVSDNKIITDTGPGGTGVDEKYMYLDPAGSGNDFNIELTDAVTYPSIGSANFRNEIEKPNNEDDGDGDVSTNKRWDISNLPANMGTAAPWRLSSLFRAIFTKGVVHPVPLTTSATTFWGDGYDNLSLISFSTVIGTHESDPKYAEQIDTVSELFYQRKNAANTYEEAPMHWTEFQVTPTTASYTGAVSYSVPATTLATYRFAGFRLNREPYNAVKAAGSFKTAMDIEVEASIFAQDGSWFVIPMPVLSSIDQNGDGAVSDEELENSLSASEVMSVFDANGNGSVTNAEHTNGLPAMRSFAQAKAVRFRRPGYSIAIKGNIAQNISPTSDRDYDDEKDPDGNAFGAVQTWIDSLACPTSVIAASGTNYKGSNWQSIQYQASPLPTDNKLYMPVSPDLVYQG